MKLGILTVVALATCLDSAHGLSCDNCNRDNLTETCGPPPSCLETVLDPCGCCSLCAKMEGESCGGPWETLGKCAKGLTCQPSSTETPVMGAGGRYYENVDPVGTCVDPVEYQRRHSPCFLEMEAFLAYQSSRPKRSAGKIKYHVSKDTFNDEEGETQPTRATAVDGSTPKAEEYSPEFENETMTTIPAAATPVANHSATTDSANMQVTKTTTKTSTEQVTTTVPTTAVESTTAKCVRKPSCTPDGYYMPMQCDGCVGECWCVRYEGAEIRGTRGQFRQVRC